MYLCKVATINCKILFTKSEYSGEAKIYLYHYSLVFKVNFGAHLFQSQISLVIYCKCFPHQFLLEFLFNN